MNSFAEPFVTPYDLRFQILGIHVRVQALFWLTGALLGYSISQSWMNAGVPGMDGKRTHDVSIIFLVMLVEFISILVHELGHSLIMRRFGIESHIVLYWFGGLAIPGRAETHSWAPTEWRPERTKRRTSNEQILISFAGPAAGFLLAGLVAVIVAIAGGEVEFVRHFPRFWSFSLQRGLSIGEHISAGNLYLYALTDTFLFLNIFWGLINLLPVYPLDGGQISRELFVQRNPWAGVQQSLLLSVIVGGGVAIIALVALEDKFMALMFASLAASSYMMLQQLGSSRGPW